jgi:phytoene desaturase
VIGAGFAGLSAACFLAKDGSDVLVIEKQSMPGGRAARLEEAGFVFDMGPSWYWMPDVFERFFNSFGKKTSDYYQLTRLDPSYRVYWPEGFTDLPADMPSLETLFESLEPGSTANLRLFLKEAEYKYRVGMQKLVHKPGLSLFEFVDPEVFKGAFQLDLLTSMEKHVDRLFKHPQLRELLKFPVLFLGALPKNTPALYSLMNYADMVGGTWYPEGGMYSIVDAMYQLALSLGVRFNFDEPVTELTLTGNRISKVITSKSVYEADVIVGAADYHHVETALLPASFRSYSNSYWNSRSMAPSCLLYYVGLNKKLPGLLHHSLFFDTDFGKHGSEIYDNPTWPVNPLFYVCASSVTDPNCAPEDHENLFFLIPVAAGLSDDDEAKREKYFELIWSRFEARVGEHLKSAIVYKKSFGYSDFVGNYNSFKGNAYGLANTLKQTAILKPSCRSKKVKNLFYAGQLTVPGPGVPPSLISGEVVAREVFKYRKLK